MPEVLITLSGGKITCSKRNKSGLIVNSETRVGNYFSVRSSTEDTPTICEGVDFVKGIMDDTEKNSGG